jgi:hypothetical protein
MMDSSKQNIANILDRMGKKLDEIGKRVDEIMDAMDIDKLSNKLQPLKQLNDDDTRTTGRSRMDIVFVVVIVVVFLFALASLIKQHPRML